MIPGNQTTRLALLLFSLLIGCGGSTPEGPKSWIDREPEERARRTFEELDVNARFVRLPDSVVRFLDVSPGAEGVDDGAWPALFIHGFAGTLGDLGPLITRTTASRRVVALDLPGFGGSIRQDSDYTVGAYVDSLRRFAKRAGLERVHLVCHSMGGQVCLAASLRDPSFIASLTLIDTAGTYDKTGFVKGISKRMGKVNVGEIRTEKGRSPADVASGDQEFVKRFVSTNPSVLAALSSFDSSYRSKVGELEVPTLIIWGEDDPIFHVSEAAFLKENITGSRLHIVEGAGHSPQLSHPGLVFAWVAEHMEQNDMRSSEK